MARMNVQLPEQLEAWIESEILSRSRYSNASQYIIELVRQDRAERLGHMDLDDLRLRLAEAEASGISNKSVDELFAEAREASRSRGLADG